MALAKGTSITSLTRLALQHLEVPKNDLDTIKSNNHGNATMQIYECYLWWRNKYDDRRKLYGILKEASSEGLIGREAYDFLSRR